MTPAFAKKRSFLVEEDKDIDRLESNECDFFCRFIIPTILLEETNNYIFFTAIIH